NRTFRHWSLLPAVVLFVVLTIYPVANLFRMSVSTIEFTQGGGAWTFTPLHNFALLRADEVVPAAIRNTLLFVVAAVAIEMVLGLALAIIVAGVTRGKGLLRTVMIFPILAVKVVAEVYLLTSGGPGTSTELVTLQLYKVFFDQNQLGYGALLSLALIAAIVAFLLVGRQAVRMARP